MFQRESWGGILYDDWSNAFPEQTTWWTTWVLFSPIFDGKNTYMKPHGLPVKIFPKSFHWIESSGQSLEWSMDSLGLKLVFFVAPKEKFPQKFSCRKSCSQAGQSHAEISAISREVFPSGHDFGESISWVWHLKNEDLPGLVNIEKTDGNSTLLLMGESTISTGPFSIANC